MSIAIKKRGETDLTVGPIFKKLIIYALPIIGVNVIQLLFNAADVAILGIFAENSDLAVAAVGSTGSLINFLIAFFIGLSIGANVLVARYMGEKDVVASRRAVGTAIVSAVICGFVVMALGVSLSKTILIWMDCPENVLGLATKYLQIYFVGMPVIMLYNFSTAILRAVGDTFRPLIFLIIGGVANIGLNIFFIVVVGWDVEGVAIATVVSQAISATLSFVVLLKSDGYSKIERKNLRIYKKEILLMVKIGLPVGIAKCLTSLSNVLIQTAINSHGDLAMTANSIGHQIDIIVNEGMHGIALASLSFISQNVGAKKFDRVQKTIYSSIVLIVANALLLGGAVILLAPILAGVFTDTSAVIELACMRIYLFGGTSAILGITMLFQEILRGLGRSFLSMLFMFLGLCVFRVVWLNTFYLLNPTLMMIYYSYPISWLIASVLLIIASIHELKKLKANATLQEVKVIE